MRQIDLPHGAVTGVGGLPHRSAADAARFSLQHLDIPVIPALPRRSPAEGSIIRGLVGMRGITVGQYGAVALDARRLDPLAQVQTDLQHDAFVGFRTFLELARGHQGWVSFQVVGPITLGRALARAGVPMSDAFEAAVRSVRARVQHLMEAVEDALPGVRQLVFVKEPDMADLMTPGFPLAPDTAIDLVSGALAAIETNGVAGLHVCGQADVASQLAAGPAVISLPVRLDLAESAGYLVRFMERGGHIAWGAAPTTGPLSSSAERPWKALSQLWCELVQRGADPGMLRRQALITPECGLTTHTPAVADRVVKVARDVGRRVRDQADATRWALGA